MHDTVFYLKFLNSPHGIGILFLTGIGLNILLCWWLCKGVDKQN